MKTLKELLKNILQGYERIFSEGMEQLGKRRNKSIGVEGSYVEK